MRKSLVISVYIFLTIMITVLVYSYATGITGLTRKTGGLGCYCHGSTPTAGVIVSITGPDSVSPGQTVMYTLSITGGPLIRGGTDIAVGRGTIDTVTGAGLQKLGGELTHRAPKPPSAGSVSFQFNYTAPQTLGPDTLYGVGNSVNNNGQSSGDQWNFSPDRIIIVRNPSGIINNSYATEFKLEQNYPNPFNPTTKIKFDVSSNFTPSGAKGLIVQLRIYDLLCHEIATLVNELLKPGSYEVEWDASNYPSGAYFYKLFTQDFSETKKLVLIK